MHVGGGSDLRLWAFMRNHCVYKNGADGWIDANRKQAVVDCRMECVSEGHLLRPICISIRLMLLSLMINRMLSRRKECLSHGICIQNYCTIISIEERKRSLLRLGPNVLALSLFASEFWMTRRFQRPAGHRINTLHCTYKSPQFVFIL